MPALHEKLRKQLEKTVIAARDIAEDAAREALKRLAVDQPKLFDHMTPDERELRNKLRAKARQLGDRRDKAGKQAIGHLAVECAYEQWHRMLFARFLAENQLLIHEELGVPVSLEECEELAKEEGTDGWTLAARFASRMLPQIFRPDDPALAVTLAPESKWALEKQLDTLPVEVFTADDSLGWVYQFWQTKRKDEVNKSGNKIGADELPAVTQLFTEHYMVLFLLHNTLGAWWAGKVLGKQTTDARPCAGNPRHAERSEASGTADGDNAPEILRCAQNDGGEDRTEDEWRKRVTLPSYEFDYLRFLPDGTPAAGTFSGWPTQAKDLKILDPCCGSGHFLVAAFDLMVRIRMKEEGLSPRDACDAVLCDNIFGLEIDPRCTQIAAFALALSACRFPETGGYRKLPELHIACSGIGPHATEEQWLKLAEQSGVPMPAIGKQPIREGLRNLHALFSQAPTLGSLIDPGRLPADLIAADYETLQPYLGAALEAEHAADEAHERAVAAAGMVKAAELLASEYALVITNVPYLGRGKQDETLKAHLEKHYKEGKADLATAFVLRCLNFCAKDGSIALVTQQNWWFLSTYRVLRSTLLTNHSWQFIITLGEEAWQSFGDRGPVAALSILAHAKPSPGHDIAGIDALARPDIAQKTAEIAAGEVRLLSQTAEYENPDHRITVELGAGGPLLQQYAVALQGVSPADLPRFGRMFWEVVVGEEWRSWQSAVEETKPYGGRSLVLWWNQHLMEAVERGQAFVRGQIAWGKMGVACRQMRDLPVTIYGGDVFDTNTAVIVPAEQGHLPAIWCFCSSDDFRPAIRRIDKKVNVTNASFGKVPFDLAHWQKVAEKDYPSGLPEPESDDPTQWLFHGRPDVSTTPLQVGVARLLGYRWPSELDDTMRLSRRARELVQRSEELLRFADDDGVVCIPAVRGERAAADRVRELLAAAYSGGGDPSHAERSEASRTANGDRDAEILRCAQNDDDSAQYDNGCAQDDNGGGAWSPGKQEDLLRTVGYGSKGLDEWLRSGFFDQHCKLFHHRPFVWHIWDGRKTDGFGALVNYHMLDAKLLERLIYTYLGDWIKRQEQAVAQGESGADARLLAAQQLQAKLKLIAEGEPPYDIFVRWKPIERQSTGWHPDLNDGVRMNIRPFMEANILRKKPNIKWSKDRGKEPERPQEQYPWFWKDGEFTGDRVNDVHLTNAEKQAARKRAEQGASC